MCCVPVPHVCVKNGKTSEVLWLELEIFQNFQSSVTAKADATISWICPLFIQESDRQPTWPVTFFGPHKIPQFRIVSWKVLRTKIKLLALLPSSPSHSEGNNSNTHKHFRDGVCPIFRGNAMETDNLMSEHRLVALWDWIIKIQHDPERHRESGLKAYFIYDLNLAVLVISSSCPCRFQSKH